MIRKIGFIGLGIMGRPMALNLIKAGYTLLVNDLDQQAVKILVEAGATAKNTAKEVAENCEMIITMLPASTHVQQVVLGEKGVLAGAKKRSIIVDMSSITANVSKQLAEEAAKKDVDFLDAPVSGGEIGAINSSLAIMVGGKKEVFEKVSPILYMLGKHVTLVGEVGCGVTAKLANQIIVNLNIAAMSEALVLAAKAGIDIEKMFQAIRGGFAGSAVLEEKLPKIMNRNFIPGGTIAINMKDITNVMNTAHEMDVPLPLTSQLLEIFHALKADGKLKDDHGGIIQYYEKMANIEVKPSQVPVNN